MRFFQKILGNWRQREAVKDFLEMGKFRKNYSQKNWGRESGDRLKQAVGWHFLNLFGIKSRKQKAAGEFLRLLRFEAMKTPEMQRNNLVQRLQGLPVTRGLQLNTLASMAELHSGGNTLKEIRSSVKGIAIDYIGRDGRTITKFFDPNSEAGRDLKNFLRGRHTVSARELGLVDLVEELRRYVEKKYKTKIELDAREAKKFRDFFARAQIQNP